MIKIIRQNKNKNKMMKKQQNEKTTKITKKQIVKIKKKYL